MFNFILLYFVFNLKAREGEEDDKIRESSGMWSTAINQPKAVNSKYGLFGELSLGFQPSMLELF